MQAQKSPLLFYLQGVSEHSTWEGTPAEHVVSLSQETTVEVQVDGRGCTWQSRVEEENAVRLCRGNIPEIERGVPMGLSMNAKLHMYLQEAPD